MKLRITAFAILASLVLSMSASVFADKKGATQTSQVMSLVSKLPASDGVVVFDMKRFLNEALPKMMAGNPALLTEINTKIDEIKAKIGIDPRQFEEIAIGLNTKQVTETQVDVEPVILARGNFNAGALVAIARLASSNSYKEEKVGERSVYVFTVKKAAEKAAEKMEQKGKMVDMVSSQLDQEMALTAFDGNTLAFGSKARVMATLTGGTTISPEITSVLQKKPTAIASFASKFPKSLATMLPLDDDELGKSINSIKFISGTMDFVGEDMALNVSARTSMANHAKSLGETLLGLQMVGKALLGSSSGKDKQLYARLIENSKVESAGNDVTFSLLVLSSDLKELSALIKFEKKQPAPAAEASK